MSVDKVKYFVDPSPWVGYSEVDVNLSIGAPGPDLLKRCCSIMEKATTHRMKYELENNSYLFQYGPTVGGLDQRRTISNFLTKNYQEKVNSEDLILTTGATNGLHLIISVLIETSAVVFVDEVIYRRALEILEVFPSIKVVTVPLTKDGTDIEALRKLVEAHKFTAKDGKLFWGMYFTIPNFHNPTGLLFSKDVCQSLVELSREHEFLICCDDVYNFLSYTEGVMPKRLFSYDNIEDGDYKGNVISNGTFSKILSPGLRTGWMECPPRCVAAFDKSAILLGGGALSHYTSGIVSSCIELGLAQEQLDFFKMKYNERMSAVIEILDERLPKSCSYIKPKGGLFIWIKLQENFVTADFKKFVSEKYKIMCADGSDYSNEKIFKNYIRITFAFYDVSVIKEAMVKFCEAIDVYLNLEVKPETV